MNTTSIARERIDLFKRLSSPGLDPMDTVAIIRRLSQLSGANSESGGALSSVIMGGFQQPEKEGNQTLQGTSTDDLLQKLRRMISGRQMG